MKNRAEKKIQIAIDKLIDLQVDLVDDPGIIERNLYNLRELEARITCGRVVNRRLKI